MHFNPGYNIEATLTSKQLSWDKSNKVNGIEDLEEQQGMSFNKLVSSSFRVSYQYLGMHRYGMS